MSPARPVEAPGAESGTVPVRPHAAVLRAEPAGPPVRRSAGTTCRPSKSSKPRKPSNQRSA